MSTHLPRGLACNVLGHHHAECAAHFRGHAASIGSFPPSHPAPRTGNCGPPSARTAPRSALEHSSGTPRSTTRASARQPRVVRMRRRTVIDTGEARSVAAAAEGTPPAVHVCGHACCAWTFLYRSAGRDGRETTRENKSTERVGVLFFSSFLGVPAFLALAFRCASSATACQSCLNTNQHNPAQTQKPQPKAHGEVC